MSGLLNRPDKLVLLWRGSNPEHLSQAFPDQFDQSSLQPDINNLMNGICVWLPVVMGTVGTSFLIAHISDIL